MSFVASTTNSPLVKGTVEIEKLPCAKDAKPDSSGFSLKYGILDTFKHNQCITRFFVHQLALVFLGS